MLEFKSVVMSKNEFEYPKKSELTAIFWHFGTIKIQEHKKTKKNHFSQA